MKEYEYNLTKGDQRRIILLTFYQVPRIKWVTILVVPVLLALSAYFVIDGVAAGFEAERLYTFLIALAGLVVGIVFLLLPLMLLSRYKLSGAHKVFAMSEAAMEIRDKNGTVKIMPENILKITVKKRYIVIKTQTAVKQYLVIDSYMLGDRSREFIEDLRTLERAKSRLA